MERATTISVGKARAPTYTALVSAAMRDTLAQRMKTIYWPHSGKVRFMVANPARPLPPDQLRLADVAFLSLDVIGASSGNRLTAEMDAYCENLRRAENLKWVQIPHSGSDRPVLGELLARGVRLTTASGANAVAVALSALAGFLALARKVPLWIEAQHRRDWRPLKGNLAPRDISGQTAVVVGMGAVGTEIARLLAGVGARVIGIRRTAQAMPHCDRVLSFNEIDHALEGADWLVLACPLADTTRRLVDSGRLALLSPGAHVINVSRGEVVVEADLIDSLRSGHLAGAYLDVFEHEPLAADSALWNLPGVLISAHSAGISSGHGARTVEIFLDNLDRWFRGAPLRNEVANTHS